MAPIKLVVCQSSMSALSVPSSGEHVGRQVVPRTPWMAVDQGLAVVASRLSRWLLVLAMLAVAAPAQTPPEIGYVFPPGGRVGAEAPVVLGGYNWTPDMEILVHTPGVRLELAGPPSEVLVPEPPYWFGKKARDNDFPLPREFPAKLSVAPDVSTGLVKWQAANANGITATGVLLITNDTDGCEPQIGSSRTELSSLPAAVVGRLSKLEEVDTVLFRAPRTGPVTIDIWSRRLGSTLNAMLELRDDRGSLVADAADTVGHDLQCTFHVEEGKRYELRLFDADFRGHRSFVYRLHIHPGPRVTATIPATFTPGTEHEVQLWGWGLATGSARLESLLSKVTIPADRLRRDASHWEQTWETPHGSTLAYPLMLAAEGSRQEPAGDSPPERHLDLPVALTGAFTQRAEEDRFWFTGRAGDAWEFACRSAKAPRPLDLTLAILDAQGTELARIDDAAGSLDCLLAWTAPKDGEYQLVVGDQSGLGGSPDAVYLLTAARPQPRCDLVIPDRIAVPLGGAAKLTIKGTRAGGFAEPVNLKIENLPAGVVVGGPIVLAANQGEVSVDLQCAPDARTSATLATVRTESPISAAGGPAAFPIAVAITMKPRVKVTPEGLDDVRKWPRGTTYPAPVLIERLEGYAGPVILEQTAHQQRVRQGITGPDWVVPEHVTRAEYPVEIPEWLETTKTSRIILNGVTPTADPGGRVRHLLQKMELRIGILPVGALLKVAYAGPELTATPGTRLELPIAITRANELTTPVRLDILIPAELAESIRGESVEVPATSTTATLTLNITGKPPRGDHVLTVRGQAQRDGNWATVSRTEVVVTCP